MTLHCAWVCPRKAHSDIVRQSYHVVDVIWQKEDENPFYIPYFFNGYMGGMTYNEEGKEVQRIKFKGP
jgi:hypothetical protein